MIIVTGAGGMIGGHLVARLLADGVGDIRCIDIKPLSEWWQVHRHAAVHNMRVDLRDISATEVALRGSDVIYGLAADMGGLGHIYTAEADIMRNNAFINLNMCEGAARAGAARVFLASSVCVYRDMAHGEPTMPEEAAWPAQPENLYGLEKIYSEQALMAYARREGFAARIARFENTYGTHGSWIGGREKAPAAICRKVAEAGPGGRVEVWGDGTAVRSFTHVDDLVAGIIALTASELDGPTNLGSPEYVTVNDLVAAVTAAAGYEVDVVHVDGPVGVHSRNFSTARAKSLGWSATTTLADGIAKTYPWMADQVARASLAAR